MPENAPKTEFYHPIFVTDIPAKGRTYPLKPSDIALKEIANRLGVPSVEALSGKLTASPSKGGFTIVGDISAQLIRSCVVTLEPVPESISETFTIRFVKNLDPDEEPGDDAIDLEPFQVEQEIDLADLLVQQVALAMTPYPRKATADEELTTIPDEKESSPFDVLKQLKNPN